MNFSWKHRNVFVTGCTGLLGSWLTKYLIDEGANVIGLVRDTVPKSILWSNTDDFKDISNKLTVVHGDLEDFSKLERIINEYEIEIVFHLGAQTIVKVANQNPISTFQSNIVGTYNILEACRRVGLPKAIVVASSDKAYGDQKTLPYDERTSLQGQHPYDVSKSCADLIATTYHNTYGLPVCITRCGNFYGPGDLNFNRIVPGTIRSVLNGEKPVIRSDGTNIRDYFYIKDGALAYMLLAEKMLESEGELDGEAFNFSNELQINVMDLVNQILIVMKHPHLEPLVLNKANNEIKHQYLSAKKARTLLNWTPKYSLNEALVETIEWYEQFFNGQ
jgi:CDP-glucose 4,6-dehydratase